ncbi:hypothetical protein LSH36_143g04039 [Paralvinella palmiformis]|uniref:Calcineurin-like phosphoesterase domain-containing protein n=1 Tax=Paralvinella palmiformis TaxID=53620 RepID=A0AAD9JWD9_9ANNE|nr:hypothetical protein LSH36_143g04039 [Paralvinella palmiformis]
MSIHAEEFQPEFILSQGDNFYPDGITSVDDPRIDILWREMYNRTNIRGLDWWISLGNHDYGEGMSHQVDRLWKLPHLWYDYIVSDGDVSVHFIIIDTEALGQRLNNYTEMMRWLDETLNSTTSDWVIVNGHHTIYSCAETGPISSTYYNELLPLLDRYYGILDIYLAGHDHDVQLLQKIDDPVYFDFVVSGAGGAAWDYEIPTYADILRDEYGINKTFFNVAGSFVAMEATKEYLEITFVNSNVTNMYTYTRYNTKAHRLQ